jgi:hypothetical protein
LNRCGSLDLDQPSLDLIDEGIEAIAEEPGVVTRARTSRSSAEYFRLYVRRLRCQSTTVDNTEIDAFSEAYKAKCLASLRRSQREDLVAGIVRFDYGCHAACEDIAGDAVLNEPFDVVDGNSSRNDTRGIHRNAIGRSSCLQSDRQLRSK